MASTVERYVASLVLSGTGDAMGFRNGGWEFCQDGRKIHNEMEALGGIPNLCIKLPKWRVSDDTVMQLATGDALVSHGTSTDKEALYLVTAGFYKECMNDMRGRSPGLTSRGCCYALQPQEPKGYRQPFDERGGGCGAAMRAMCIGLRYPREADLDDLISYSVEAGRMTHHNPTGYLGSLASALFVSYSIQGKAVREWGAGLMAVLPKALHYIESQGRYVKENTEAWSYFTTKWTDYLRKRGITDGQSDPKFPKRYDVEERDAFYRSVSFDGWGGASGHDAPMIAYDALLGSGDSWEELCKRGILHYGDNDSTGVIAGACYGAMFGFKGVPENNYKDLEYRERLSRMGVDLYKLSNPDGIVSSSDLESFGTCGMAPLTEEDSTTSTTDEGSQHASSPSGTHESNQSQSGTDEPQSPASQSQSGTDEPESPASQSQASNEDSELAASQSDPDKDSESVVSQS